ncbi:protein esc1 [Cladorrhinum sp. PSN259]|nr:protein esc1 [Cladorrhinum sp. PSN259]
MEQQRPASQKFPAGLTGILNSPDDHRDSAYYSSTDSKHNSTASGLGVLSPPSSGFQTSPVDKTPSPTTTAHLLPQPLVSPTNSNMSVASIVSPTTPGSADPRRFDRPQSLESAPNSATFGHGDLPEALSRRESVDSRFNQGFNNLGLGNSPYATHNHSTTSIHQTLQQQRNPRANLDSLAINRISNGYQPNAERKPEGGIPKMKVAPAITGPATSQIARAAEPTKGQAWAFPEDELHRIPSTQAHSLINSRRSSIAESLASSQFTTESRLPVGQRRLEDSLTPSEYQRLSTASQEYSTTHHHTLQHRQISDLQNEESSPQSGNQPYSRTPELRVTHKLAERKRRTEMKELFDQLRDLMPQERGQKASKWEILTKAISEHQRQSGIIRDLGQHIQAQNDEITKQRAAIEDLQRQLQEFRQYPQKHHMHGGAAQHPPDQYAADFARSRPPELPPLRGNFEAPPVPTGPDSMTGVQYDGPRVNGSNGFRPAAGPRY